MLAIFKKPYWLLIILLIGLGFGSAIIFRKNNPNPSPAKLSKLSPEVQSILEITPQELVLPSPQEIEQTLPLTGTLSALNTITLKAKVAGTLETLAVREGESVKAGQILGRMSLADLVPRRQEKAALLASAQASLNLAEKQRYSNQQLLSKGFISQNSFDNTSSQFEIARANVDAAQAQLRLAEQALEDAVLRAPFNGVVAQRLAEPGEKLPLDAKIVTLVDLSVLEMQAPVPANDLLRVNIGQTAKIIAQGYEHQLSATVVRINPSTSSGTRSVIIYLRVENPQLQVRSGVFAQGDLLVSKTPVKLALPQSAIIQEKGEAVAYSVESGHIKRRSLGLGKQGSISLDDDQIWVEVLNGLDGKSPVIRQTNTRFTDGKAVRIVSSR